MRTIPSDPTFDSTFALLREGYAYISNRCERYQTDLFQTRLLLQKTICMQGQEAARLFYDQERFERKGAMPERVKQTLFGFGGVQGLDDQAHEHRKAVLMSLMTPEHIAQLTQLMEQQWQVAIEKWQRQEQVYFFAEMRQIICCAVCMWCGIPLQASEVRQRTAEIGARIDGAGAVGPKHWWARYARWRTEQWIQNIVEEVRNHQLDPPPASALYTMSWHRDLDGNLLDSHVVAVELLNIVRPTVAVARFITFAALAIHEHPECKPKLQAGDEPYAEWFAQEVRRFYPFFPFVVACTRQDFVWNDYRFAQGTRVLLDLYGTNHDPRLWHDPQRFWPERFQEKEITPFNLIPQGGGDYYVNHRCAGEWITLSLIKAAQKLLVNAMSYTVPTQDLQISLTNFPALPQSHFVIREVQRARVPVA